MVEILKLGLVKILKLKFYPARALRALGLLLADGALTVGWQKTFWRVGHFFFNENGRNSEVEKSFRRLEMNCGLQTGCRQNLGSYSIKLSFGPQKKHPLLYSNHVLATTGKSCANKKVPFSQINISVSANCRCFFGKNGFLATKKTLFGHT